jgi:hypothetical protein
MEAADSRLGAPPYRKLCEASAVRRISHPGLESVADSWRGAPVGVVEGMLSQTGPVLMPIALT